MADKFRLLRYLAYTLEILVMFVLQSTPAFLPEILGSKPMLLLPVVLTIAVFENEWAACVFGFLGGVLTDLGATGKLGFYTIMLTLLCFVIGYCARNFFVTNLLNASVIGVGCIMGLILLNFLFTYVWTDMANASYHFLYHFISRIVYTALFFVPFYFLNRLLCHSLKES